MTTPNEPEKTMQMISMRLPKRMIQRLKEVAARKGVGYQPLIRFFIDEELMRDRRRQAKK
jgi:predicted DNA binding CopG/RHH family protein